MTAGVPESIETLKAEVDLIKSWLKDAEDDHAAWSNRLDHWMQRYLHCIALHCIALHCIERARGGFAYGKDAIPTGYR